MNQESRIKNCKFIPHDSYFMIHDSKPMFEDLKPQINESPKSKVQSLKLEEEIGKTKEPVSAKLRQGELEDIFSGAGIDKDRPFLNEANEEYKKKRGKEAEEKDVFGNKKKIIFISLSVSAVILIIVFFVALNKWGSPKPVGTEQPSAETQKPAESTGESGSVNNESGIINNESGILPEQGGVIMDTDGDGLTDEEEAKLGTSPDNVDTDGDGLSDREEINVYKTDPLNPDTDNDGYSDGVEVKGGYNPKGEGKLISPPFPKGG